MGLNLNPENIVANDNDFSPIPDGKYLAYVHDIVEEERTSSAGNKYEQARVQFCLTGGEYNNRRAFKNYIFDHPNEQAASIGQQGLRQLWSAQGEISPEITVHGLDNPTVIEITLKTKEGSNGYGPRQEVVFTGRVKADAVPTPQASGSAAPTANPFA
jgi:hypothetical protein